MQLVVAEIDRCRWQIESSFMGIKQHLRIKSLFGTPERAVVAGDRLPGILD